MNEQPVVIDFDNLEAIFRAATPPRSKCRGCGATLRAKNEALGICTPCQNKLDELAAGCASGYKECATPKCNNAVAGSDTHCWKCNRYRREA